MQFRTEVQIPEYGWRIGYSHRGVVLGSCFAEHIGGWLAESKFPVEVNPFGALYNPLSMAAGLERLEAGREFGAEELFCYRGLWHSLSHHGDYSGTDADAVLGAINLKFREAAKAYKKADYLLLTLGTAWVYEHRGRVVANCHKLPASEFTRRRLSVEEIAGALAPAIGNFLSRRPDARVLLTVSPVIHRGDGLVENQLSKSTLLLACDELCRRFAPVACFPAYEIVTSELRDYRFYAADMCHPSEQAVGYIRERFAEALLTPESRDLAAAVGEILRAAGHRPLHPGSDEYPKFRAAMLRKAETLQKQHPEIDLTHEIRFFKGE